MKERLKLFFRRENGAVTVDWVVLCALMITLATIVVASMTDATTTLTDRITAFLDGYQF
ncbi:hypothetical protein [Pseudooceanicola aestuarii]|uniref:hypothetical protein n=1 Tax=Pseudooceanicola aestuarii TaxID=2697319 RepID=UPI0019534641|nr:hypothetical protein [Pseudooceanicola aestuarii]